MRKLIVSTCTVIVGLTLLATPVSAKNVLDPKVVYDEARIWCEKFDQDVSQIMGQVDLESSYDSENVSHSGAQGLMQLMPDTAVWMIEDMKKNGLIESDFVYNWKNYKQNLMVGIYHMYWLQEYYRGKYPEEHLLDVSYGAYWKGIGAYESYVKKYGRYSTADYSVIVRNRVPKYEKLVALYIRQEKEAISRGGETWRSTGMEGPESTSEKKKSLVEYDSEQKDITYKESPTSSLVVTTSSTLTKDMDMVIGEQITDVSPAEKEGITWMGILGVAFIGVIVIGIMSRYVWTGMKEMKSTSLLSKKGIQHNPLPEKQLRSRLAQQ